MIITTNHNWRLSLYGYQLTDQEQAEFDWLDWGKDGDAWGETFFKYKGQVYSLDEFMWVSPGSPFEGWDGYHSDSFFSGVVVRLADDGDHYQIGTYRS